MVEESVFTPREFKAWLKRSVPGQKTEYFVGRLDQARHTQKLNKASREDVRCADQARMAARRGLVDLVQRRIKNDLYSYLAIKCGDYGW